jgi:hypothetical protein
MNSNSRFVLESPWSQTSVMSLWGTLDDLSAGNRNVAPGQLEATKFVSGKNKWVYLLWQNIRRSEAPILLENNMIVDSWLLTLLGKRNTQKNTMWCLEMQSRIHTRTHPCTWLWPSLADLIFHIPRPGKMSAGTSSHHREDFQESLTCLQKTCTFHRICYEFLQLDSWGLNSTLLSLMNDFG